ncbi:MAG: DNA cytosine methyltransferase, partial [Deltaproteobacteria bacterium]|nr:DNA cytosine methyltransferase [Deltaproteobacteria bacterium]
PARIGHRPGIFHLFRRDEDEQYRGVSALSAGVKLFRNLGDALAVAGLIKYYGTDQAPQIDEPLDTCTTKPRFGVTLSWISKMRGTNIGQMPDTPLQTVTACPHFAAVYAFLTKYYGKSDAQAADAPLRTVCSREDLGLVLCYVDGEPYVIVDIGMRMLQPREQAGCMGFPPEYILERTASGPISKEAQNFLIGNAVCPGMAEALIRANSIEDEARAYAAPSVWQETFWPSREAAQRRRVAV